MIVVQQLVSSAVCITGILKKSSVVNGAILEIARTTRFVVSEFVPHIRPSFEIPGHKMYKSNNKLTLHLY